MENGRIYNFDISPYKIFTSGLEVEDDNMTLYTQPTSSTDYEALANYIQQYEPNISETLYEIDKQGNKIYSVTVNFEASFYDIFLSEVPWDYYEYRNSKVYYFNSDIGIGYADLYAVDESERETERNKILVSENVWNIIKNGASDQASNQASDQASNKKIRLGLLDINFFRNYKVEDENGQWVSSNVLSATIGNVYKKVRNLCIILMMLVLLYIGIRIIISTVASDQSKYKKMLVDWLIGLCLLFIMHYIMSFLMNMNTIILNMLSNDEGDSYYVSIAELADNGADDDSTWLDIVEGNNPADYTDTITSREFFRKKIIVEATDDDQKSFNVSKDGFVNLQEESCKVYKNVATDKIDFSKWGDNGKIYLSAALVNSSNDNVKYAAKAIYKANLMEYSRTLSSFALTNSDNLILYEHNGGKQSISPHSNSEETNYYSALGYGILYLGLVIEMIMFFIIYLKRVLQLAMLTMIAPLVAFMYPLDKVGDGQAQAYNGWLKDYMFNILIQPLHLLLYSVFVNAASQLFQKNVIYAIAVYAFMIPAEKYFKKIFGFDKASGSPPGGFAGAMGGPLAMEGFKALTGLGPGKGSKGGSGGGDKDRRKLNLKRDKLKDKVSESTSTDTGTPPSPTSSGLGSGRGLGRFGTGGTGGAGGVGSRNTNGSSNRPSPGASAPENGKGDKFKNLLRGGGIAAKKGFTRAITGGKYNSLKGLSGRAVFNAVGGNFARNGTKLAGRALGTAALGTAGLMVGAASAIATGDIKNLSKGVLTGTAAGWNRGGEIANWGTNKVGNFLNDVDREWINLDEGRRAEYFKDEAMEKFQDTELTSTQKDTVGKFAEYVDFNGDDKKVDAYIEAAKQLYGTDVNINGLDFDQMNAVDSMVSDAQQYGNLENGDNMRTFEKAKIEEIQKNVNVDPASVSDAEIDEIIKAEKEKKKEEIEANKKERYEIEYKRDAAIANASNDEEKNRIKERYQKDLDKKDAERRRIRARMVNSDEARENARNQIAQQKADAEVKRLFGRLAEQTQNTWKKAKKIKS